MKISMTTFLSQKASGFITCFPKYRLATSSEAFSNLRRLALPLILMSASYAPQLVKAGPLAYAACVTECSLLTLGGFLPACIAFCTPFLAAPTP